MNPKHPVYVISKGRWESRLTAQSLDNIGVPYSIVIEPQEYEQYRAALPEAQILTLPFSDLGQGSIPARNWVWEHAAATGAERHWILDDNIGQYLKGQGVTGFFRLNRNLKTPVASGTIFRCAEDFVDRYENVALAGFNYFLFAPRKTQPPPYYLNTRIYSCILIRNDLDYRWRGRYNEDTDLSIRVLKDGWCTILFNAFLCYKRTTMTMSGGNTDELYRQDDDFDGRFEMAESLRLQHPDIVRIVEKWGRFQHSVDYTQFKANALRLRAGVETPSGVDNYGMVLQECIDGQWIDVILADTEEV